MADVQARREARRQKILQNAKKRLNRLYDRPFEEGSKEETGTGCTSDDTELQKEVIEEKNLTCETCSHSNSAERVVTDISQQTEVSESSRRDIQDIVNQHRSNNDTQETYVQPSNKSDGDIPGIRHRSTVKICKPPSTRAVEETEEENQTIDDRGQSSAVTPYHQFEMFKVLGCILLAILCRMVAKTGYGLLYFQVMTERSWVGEPQLTPPCPVFWVMTERSWIGASTDSLMSCLLGHD